MSDSVEKFVQEARERLALKTEAELRAMLPLVGRIDCPMCLGFGVTLSSHASGELFMDGKPIGSIRLMNIIHECRCASLVKSKTDV